MMTNGIPYHIYGNSGKSKNHGYPPWVGGHIYGNKVSLYPTLRYAPKNSAQINGAKNSVQINGAKILPRQVGRKILMSCIRQKILTSQMRRKIVVRKIMPKNFYLEN
jgi:hypothetical protein